MSDFRPLNSRIIVSPQISVADIETAKAKGVSLIINNRPDGESPDQTPGSDIAAAADAAGIAYTAIPVTQAGFSEPQIEAMQTAMDAADGKVLAYCRSGTRSTFLWSLAQAKQGIAPEEIADGARQAGYDISPIRPMVEMLAGKSGD